MRGGDWIRPIGDFARQLNTIGKKDRKLTNPQSHIQTLLDQNYEARKQARAAKHEAWIERSVAEAKKAERKQAKQQRYEERKRERAAQKLADERADTAKKIEALRAARLATQPAFTDDERKAASNLSSQPSAQSERGMLSELDKRSYKKAIEFDARTKTAPKLFFTLNFNQENSLDSACNRLRNFWDDLNTMAYGKGWKQNPALAPAWFVAEHVDTNLHFHGVARFTEALQKRLAVTARKIETVDPTTGVTTSKVLLSSPRISLLWQKYAPAGSIEVRRIDDLDKTIGYMLKDVKTIRDTNRIIVSPRFEKGLA